MDLDISDSSSKQEMHDVCLDTSALSDQALTSISSTATARPPAAASLEPAGAASAPSPTANQQVEALNSFDDLVASLSLQQRSQLHRQEGRHDHRRPAAAVPAVLVETMQQALDLLEELLPNGSDAAARQMLWKIQSLWHQLRNPMLNVSDPLFVFRDGPVSCAAKQGKLLLLEDFDSPSQATTERLNSLLEPEPSFALTEDITQGADGVDVLLPLSFQVCLVCQACLDDGGNILDFSFAMQAAGCMFKMLLLCQVSAVCSQLFTS
jgi:hypothetical protein